MKKALSWLLVLALAPAVFAEDNGGAETISLTIGSGAMASDTYTWSAEEAGTLTVVIDEAEPGWTYVWEIGSAPVTGLVVTKKKFF